MSTDKLHALFFTDRGAGPDSVSLWTEPVAALPEHKPGDAIGARALGLRVGMHVEIVGNDDERHFAPLLFARAGGYLMDEATVRALHAQFGAWLDAHCLAARAAAEAVAEDHGVRLLKTSMGEWGVATAGEDDEGREWAGMEVTWFADESAARHVFAVETDMFACESCGAIVDEVLSTTDGVDLCPPCMASLRASKSAAPFHCSFDGCGGCGWDGTGAELAAGDRCPQCGGDVEESDDDAPAAEGATP